MTTLDYRPRLPLPPPIRGAETGGWAHNTITVRQGEIARRVLAENDLSPGARGRILALIAELPAGPIRLLRDAGAPDLEAWGTYAAPYLGRDWLSIPWFFAETYYYRRIVEAVHYFRRLTEPQADPFHRQKQEALVAAQAALPALAARQATLAQAGDRPAALRALLTAALWGNRADLSLWPADAANQPAREAGADSDERLLADDLAAAAAHLAADPAGRLDLIIDNAGFELITDLLLVDFRLAQHPAATAVLHVKLHPTFVSDAVPTDIATTIAHLAAAADETVSAIGNRLAAALAGGRLRVAAHPFWTSPLPGWELPADLRVELAPARLVISKGDVNYRRLLGDRHWSFSAPFADILAYFPAPLLALRTLKAQLAAGIDPARAAAAQRHDPHWLTSGRWGVAQLALGEHSR